MPCYFYFSKRVECSGVILWAFNFPQCIIVFLTFKNHVRTTYNFLSIILTQDQEKGVIPVEHDASLPILWEVLCLLLVSYDLRVQEKLTSFKVSGNVAYSLIAVSGARRMGVRKQDGTWEWDFTFHPDGK